MFDQINIAKGTALALVVFVVLGLGVVNIGVDSQFDNLLSIASFLFGIFVAFSIASNHARLNKVNEVLKVDGGILLFIYKSSAVFGEKTQNRVRELIDNYLIDQIDYYLWDYRYSNQSFLVLFDYLVSLTPNDQREEIIYSEIIDQTSDLTRNRKQVEALVQERMLSFEWISILSLLAIIIFLVFYSNNGSFVSRIGSILLSTSAVILVFVLRDLDNLRWKEKSWIWEPLEILFQELKLLPYYPKVVVDQGRVKPDKGSKIRLATYPNSYPDMTGKKVEVVEI